MPVPNSFASATTSIPLSQLDQNFNTPITLGNTAIQLGNTVTTLNNMTLANATVSSGNVTVTSASLSGNLTFTGTGNRITGDFSNVTQSSRVVFQTSTTNGFTGLEAAPNGTSNTVLWTLSNANDVTNASTFQYYIDSVVTKLDSGKRGTGSYLPMAFFTGGSERVRVDTSGNVGIGTSSPTTRLTISSSGANGVDLAVDQGNSVASARLFFSNGTAGQAYSISNDTGALKFNRSATAGSSTGTESMRIDSSGNVGIGTSSPSYKLDVRGRLQAINSAAGTATVANLGNDDTSGTSVVKLAFTNGGTTKASINAAVYNNDYLTFNTGSDTERARILSTGQFVAATTSAYNSAHTFRSVDASVNTFALAAQHTATNDDVRVMVANCPNYNGDTGYLFIGSRSGGDRIYIRTSGNVQNTNNSYGAISDIKLKENIVDATPKLEKLNQVRVVNYNLVGEEQKLIGVVAQELEQIFPGMIEESEDRDSEGNLTGETTKAIKYSVFVPMLIKALQEQQQMIETLQAKVAALEGKK